MTKLEFAFQEASKLPPKDQDALAEWILEEIVSEKRWNELFSNSPDVLSKLADEGLAEYRAAKIESVAPDTL